MSIYKQLASGDKVLLTPQEIQILDKMRGKWANRKVCYGAPKQGVWPITETSQVKSLIAGEKMRQMAEEARKKKQDEALKQQLSQLTNETKTLQGNVVQLNQNLGAQISTQKGLQQQCSTLSTEIQTLKTTITELNRKLEAQNVLQAQHDSLSVTVQNLNQTIRQLSSELETSRTQKALSDANAQQMSLKLDALTTALTTMQPLLQQITNLQQQIQSQNLEIATLRETLDILLLELYRT